MLYLALCSFPSLIAFSCPPKNVTVLTLAQIAGLGCKIPHQSCTALDPNGHAFLLLPQSVMRYR